jgi:hypothetical protein
MSVPPRSFSPAALADARYRYEQTKEAVASIAARLGIGERTLHSNIHKWDWYPRRPRLAISPRKAETLGAPAPVEVMLPVLDAEAARVAEAIQSTVQRTVAAIGSIVAKLPPSRNTAEAERAARALATLTRTLQEVLRLTAPQAPSDEPGNDRGPDDPDDFAKDLVRRMDEFARRHQAAVRDEPGAGIS